MECEDQPGVSDLTAASMSQSAHEMHVRIAMSATAKMHRMMGQLLPLLQLDLSVVSFTVEVSSWH
jgi:hypothetical protein